MIRIVKINNQGEETPITGFTDISLNSALVELNQLIVSLSRTLNNQEIPCSMRINNRVEDHVVTQYRREIIDSQGNVISTYYLEFSEFKPSVDTCIPS